MAGFCSPMPTMGFGLACAAGAAMQRRATNVSTALVTRSSNAVGRPELRSGVRGGGRRQLRGVRLGLARPPLRLGRDGTGDHAVAMTLDRGQHRAYELLAEVVRLEPQLAQLGVRRVVVVLLLLHTRVLEVLDLDVVAELRAGTLRELGELEHGELL